MLQSNKNKSYRGRCDRLSVSIKKNYIREMISRMVCTDKSTDLRPPPSRNFVPVTDDSEQL